MKSKQPKPKEPRSPQGGQGQTYTERDLKEISPLNEQFEPTESSPIPQRQKMAGVS